MATLLFPTELPDKPLTNGMSWNFVRVIGAGNDALQIPMTARYEGMEDYNGVKLHKVTQTFEQTIESYQDAFYQPTTDKEAAVRVTKGRDEGHDDHVVSPRQRAGAAHDDASQPEPDDRTHQKGRLRNQGL
jgi:hypothetical protein